MKLQVFAWPRILALKDLIVSFCCWRMLCNFARAIMLFSFKTASFLISWSTSFSDFFARLRPAVRTRSFRSSSVQHSSSWMTTSWPSSLEPIRYSSQRIMKYAQSSLFAASEIVGLSSSLIGIGASGGAGAVSAAVAGLAWAVAWRFSKAVRSDASVRSSSCFVSAVWDWALKFHVDDGFSNSL